VLQSFLQKYESNWTFGELVDVSFSKMCLLGHFGEDFETLVNKLTKGTHD
jgi:hypothetical protein